MKQLLLILLFSVTTLSISAQKSTIDERLLAKYSSQELKALQVENPEELEYLTYCIENAFYVGDIPQEKIDANPERFKEISLQSSTITNFYELDLKIETHIARYFIIKGTDKLLMVKSKDQILLELKK
jgi:hypothetical protein